jgi:hypothetical protein
MFAQHDPFKQPCEAPLMIRELLSVVFQTATGAGTCAGETYAGVGLHGVILGFAQPSDGSFTVRCDWATPGKRQKQTTEVGVRHDVELGCNCIGLLGDWFSSVACGSRLA